MKSHTANELSKNDLKRMYTTREDVSLGYGKYLWKKRMFIIVCVVISILIAGYAVTVGSYPIGFFESYQIIINHILGNVTDATKDLIVWESRLPRIIAGALVGVGLSIAGATMQSTMKNPLADPYTTGISSGASFGATIAIILGITVVGSSYGVVINAFIFSLIPAAVIIVISGLRKASPTVMILSGIAVMYVFNALTTVIMLMANPEDLAAVYNWQVGTLAKSKWETLPVMAAVTLIGSVVLVTLSNKLNILATGDESAKSLGIDANKLRLFCLVVVSFLAAGIVSFTGVIGFVGLVAPHVARIFIGSDNRYLLPASAAFGVALVLISDVIGRTVIYPAVLQVGVVTAFLGGPLFLYLHNISLTLNEPGLVCIIGPNGVGKSTLIKCINKILQPDSGQIFLNNKNINDMSFKEISKIMGYVPAAANDMFSMTVIDSILIGRYPHKNWSSPTNEDVDIACDTMEMMSIIHLALRNLNELSAGQHQRASIARGLAQLPQVLILDEPTANLDVRHQLMVTNLLSSLSHKNDMMILMISHDLNIAAKYADKIIIMSTPGIIYKIGTPGEVITPEVMRYVYGVDCMIENVQGHPHVILLDALSDENIRKMHEGSE